MDFSVPPALAFAISLVAGLIAVSLVKRIDYARGWVVKPRPDRWHLNPTAHHGGIGIVLAFIVGFGGAAFAMDEWPTRESWLVLLGGAWMFGAGLVDDHRSLAPSTKIILQLASATIIIAGLGWLLPMTPRFLFNTVLTVFWFIGIINAVNLTDGMDGLASGLAVITATVLSVMLIVMGNPHPQLLAMLAALAGALIAFLVFNFKPASIFMGDSGSLFVGFMLAAAVVATVREALPGPTEYGGVLDVVVPFLIPSLTIALPIFDTVFVTFSRTWGGRAAMSGSTDHSFYQLTRIGFSEVRTVLTLYVLGAGGGAIAIWLWLWPRWGIVPAGLYLLFLILFGVYLERLNARVAGANGAVSPKARVAQWIRKVLVERQIGPMVSDMLCAGFAYYAAFLLRYEGEYVAHAQVYGDTLPIVILLTVLLFFAFRVYRPLWTGIAFADMRHYAAAFLALPVGLMLYYHARGIAFSPSLVIIFTLLCAALVLGSRMLFRGFDQIVSNAPGRGGASRRGLVIYGAGNMGRVAADYVRRDAGERYRLIGFVDDNPELRGRSIWGYRVLGDRKSLARLLRDGAASSVLISSPKIDAAALARELGVSGAGIEVFRMSVDWNPVQGG